ncbi:DHH family phosphoesterase [Patescibacteria group bacterium]|jgi:phosphoesterase RecJ-like protein|nr:DHH family phosphoesterase [Patescibacteria group bacterium]
MALKPNQQAVELIGRAKNILLVTREQADTDAIASVLALGLVLKKLNKSFETVIPGMKPESLPNFLPKGVEVMGGLPGMRPMRIKLNVKDVPLSELSYNVADGQLEITVVPKHGEWKPNDVAFAHGDDRYDLVIAVGAADMGSMGELFRNQADFLYRTTVINFDHKPTNEYWGQVNLVDLNAVSTSEVIHGFLTEWNRQHVDTEVATAILAGMISQTRSFRSPNVTPKTLKTASELVEQGARRADIVQGLWRTQSVSTLKLWGRALSRLEYDTQHGLVWASINDHDFAESGASHEALEGVVDELIAYAPEAKAVCLLTHGRNGTMCSVHAQAPLSAMELARPFNGTGDRQRATFTHTGHTDQQEATAHVIGKIKEVLAGNAPQVAMA